MTNDEARRIESVLDFAYRGIHHMPCAIKKHPNCAEANVYGGISTYDYDVLTRLVVAAHHFAVRVEIASSGPGRIKILLHPRQRTSNRMWNRHPTIEQAIEGCDFVAAAFIGGNTNG